MWQPQQLQPLTESHQQHLALYMDRHLRSIAIMIEVTSRHVEYTHFDLDCSRMTAVAQQSVQRNSRILI